MTEIFRPVLPPNKLDQGLPEWAVYDSRRARPITRHKYTKAFAQTLADAMNWAFKEGSNR